MEGLSFTIFQIGHGENDADYNFCGYSFGDRDHKTPQHVWMKFPYLCVLIKHPKEGYLLYDCGPGLGAQDGRRSPESCRINPAFIQREEFIDRQLEKVGVSVGEIRRIIVSHGHWDHFGGLELLHGAPGFQGVIMSEKDFANGLVATHRAACGYSDTGYYRQDFEVGADFDLIDEDMELCEGVELVLFEGHTPGVIGLVLHCEEQTYIFPSDAVTSSINYGPPVVYPSMIADSLGFVRAVKKLRALQRKYNARIIFSHDPWQCKELRLAPYFYR